MADNTQMNDNDKRPIVYESEFNMFLNMYKDDRNDARVWRGKFEKKLDEEVIKPLHRGNGKPSLFIRVDRLEQIIKRVGAGITIIGGLIIAWLKSR